MKRLDFYNMLKLKTDDEVFDHLMYTLTPTIKGADFFVSWDKAIDGRKVNVNHLEKLNTLLGSETIEEDFRKLLYSSPEVAKVVPMLLAIRDEHFYVLRGTETIDYSVGKAPSSPDELEDIVMLAKESGLLEFIATSGVSDLADYYQGVEVGMDTNARKNRSGSLMEDKVEEIVADVCCRNGYSYIPQATATSIKRDSGISVPTDKSMRRFDFAIYTGSKVVLIETNYYSGGGSKLKSVSGEFVALSELLAQCPEACFVWITDGLGWNTAKLPLRETFEHTGYVLNLKAAREGGLEEICNRD